MATQPHLLASSGSKGWAFLTFTGTPGSINDNRNKRGGHWTKDRAHKQEWEGVFLTGLMTERVPKRLDYVKIWVTLQFYRQMRRDPENFRHPFVKPFADCLVKAGYITDDNPDFFTVMDFVIADRRAVLTDAQKRMKVDGFCHVALLYRRSP